MRNSAFAFSSRVTMAALSATAKSSPNISTTRTALSTAFSALGVRGHAGYGDADPNSDSAASTATDGPWCQPAKTSVSESVWWSMFATAMA